MPRLRTFLPLAALIALASALHGDESAIARMKKDLYFFPYKSGTSNLLLRSLKFIYGRGKRD